LSIVNECFGEKEPDIQIVQQAAAQIPWGKKKRRRPGKDRSECPFLGIQMPSMCIGNLLLVINT